MIGRIPETVLIAASMLLCGCMAWRSVCLEPKVFAGADVKTVRKYEILKVQYDAGGGSGSADSQESSLEDLLGSPESLDRIMQYRPGVFEPRGVPVTLVVKNWQCEKSGRWTWFLPFTLTATIVPAFLTDEYFGEIEVFVDGVGSRRFRCHVVDSWHLSCLGPLGLIPYPQPDHPSACIWARNRGEVSLEPMRQGVADAIAASLWEMEKVSK